MTAENPLVEGILNDAKARASSIIGKARADAEAIARDGH